MRPASVVLFAWIGCARVSGGDTPVEDTAVEMDSVVPVDSAPALSDMSIDDNDVTVVPATDKRLALGGSHTCLRTKTRGVLCWGANTDHLLGTTTTLVCERKPYVPQPCSPTPVSPDGLPAVEEVDVGPHSCARTIDGALWCWGPGGRGGYGVHWTSLEKCRDGQCAPKPVRIPLSGTVSGIAVGADFTCLRMSDESVRCSGENRSGQLGVITGETCGIPGEKCSTKFVPIPEFDRVSVLRAAGGTCAIRSDGTLWCWGPSLSGVPCDSGSICFRSPTKVAGLTDLADVTLGPATCALTRNGRVWCWGRNVNGELGRSSSETCYEKPCSLTPLPLDLRRIHQVAAGNEHVCARHENGTVFCWGKNDVGQLGIGAAPSAAVPTEVAGLTDVVEIGARLSMTCARKRDESVWCWGDNMFGQLGDGTTTDRNRPTRALASAF